MQNFKELSKIIKNYNTDDFIDIILFLDRVKKYKSKLDIIYKEDLNNKFFNSIDINNIYFNNIYYSNNIIIKNNKINKYNILLEKKIILENN